MPKIRDDFEGVTFVYDEHTNAHQLKAGDKVPDWATVGDHLLATASGNAGATSDADDNGPTAPPREGRGSGKQAWQDYANALGVTFPKDAKKEQIVELVDAALAAQNGDADDDNDDDDANPGNDGSDDGSAA